MNTYDIQLHSQSFKVKTEHNEKAFQALKSEVDKKIVEIQRAHKKISMEKALFLACLHFAEDKLRLRQALDQNIASLETQAQSILNELESSSQGAGLEIL